MIYLAGPMFGEPNSAVFDWRRKAAGLLVPMQVLDPSRRDFRGREAGAAAEIVLGDIRDITESSALLALAERPSWGTAMEIRVAAEAGKPVVAVCSGPISPWLAFHATVFRDLETACAYLRGDEW